MVIEREGTLRDCMEIVTELIELHCNIANNELKFGIDTEALDKRLDYIGCLYGLYDLLGRFRLDENEYFVRFDLDDFK